MGEITRPSTHSGQFPRPRSRVGVVGTMKALREFGAKPFPGVPNDLAPVTESGERKVAISRVISRGHED